MEYDAKLAPINKAIVTPQGFFKPLCNSCTAPDCTNPIKEMTISIAGRPIKSRVWVEHANMVRQVTHCKGYIGDQILSVDAKKKTSA